MAIRQSETARQALQRDARGRFVAVPRQTSPPRARGLHFSVDPLWVVAVALLVSIACLDYGAIVKSPGVIIAGVVAGAIGVVVMLEADGD